MTYIPGTGTVSIPKNQKTQIVEDPEKSRFQTFVNVKELKNPTPVDLPEPEWYFQLKYWMIFGAILSLTFALLAIFNYRFLFLLPLGPYAAYLGWHIRKYIKRHNHKFDAFS